MSKVTDIALVSTGNVDDTDVKNGDFYSVPSDTQHVKDILNAAPGWYKNVPSIGVAIMRYKGAPAKRQELIRAIKINLKADNIRVDSVSTQILDKAVNVYITGEREGVE